MKIRPQILVAMIILGGTAIFSLAKGAIEVTTMCIAGVIAISKDLLVGE